MGVNCCLGVCDLICVICDLGTCSIFLRNGAAMVVMQWAQKALTDAGLRK
jgi:hypothetical protein